MKHKSHLGGGLGILEFLLIFGHIDMHEYKINIQLYVCVINKSTPFVRRPRIDLAGIIKGEMLVAIHRDYYYYVKQL